MHAPVSASLGSLETYTEACLPDLGRSEQARTLGVVVSLSGAARSKRPQVNSTHHPAILGLPWRFAWDMKRSQFT